MPKKQIVPTTTQAPSVRVSARGALRLRARHPWVYRSDIVENVVKKDKDVAPGAVVRVLDERGKFLGTALYSSSSQIAIRMISHGSVDDLPALVTGRIREAMAYRKDLIAATNAYRVVFSEADFLPGLIIDRYHDVVTLQVLTQAMDGPPVREAKPSSIKSTLAKMRATRRQTIRPWRGSWSGSTRGFANWNNCRRANQGRFGETRRPRRSR